MNDQQLADLARWLRAEGLAGADSIRATPLSGGQSNPTYIVDAGAQRFVLRKKPPGVLLPSAHAIDREYRVMRALESTDVPVPRMLRYCDSDAIVGTPFYLMAFVEGRALVDQSLPGMTPAERGAIYADLNRVIAALHSVNLSAVGLDDYGRKGNYFARQIARWSKQTLDGQLAPPEALRRLIDWLPTRIPPGDETTLVHGDYRLDNVILHPTQPRVIAVVDWELSTLGHPMADFSYHAMSWRTPPAVWRGIGGLDLQALGIPGERDYIRMYAQASGRDPGEHWEFFLAYNFFRIAAILHGIANRAASGTAAAPDAAEMGRKVAPLAELGWQCAQRYEAA